jgi:DUF4097 and DUF4098 domain-containing protein YvlB
MKTLRWIVPGAAALVLAAAVTQTALAKESETLNQAYDTGAHPRLSLANVNGGVTIDAWDKNKVEVTALKTARNQEDLDDMRVSFEKNDDHISIRVEYKRDHHDWDHNESGGVDFTLHVPRGTEIDRVELVNGDVKITGVEGDVEASSVNGEVEGQKLGGDVALSTVNGEVSLVANSGVTSIRMNSVNGGINLYLPKKFDARIEAGTIHGDITAIDGVDVDATRFTGSSMKGVIGKGTMKVDLNTVNGSIQIRRAGESEDKNRG